MHRQSKAISKLNWDLITNSPTLNAHLDTAVNNIPTMFVKTGPGISFVIATPEDALFQIAESQRYARKVLRVFARRRSVSGK